MGGDSGGSHSFFQDTPHGFDLYSLYTEPLKSVRQQNPSGSGGFTESMGVLVTSGRQRNIRVQGMDMDVNPRSPRHLLCSLRNSLNLQLIIPTLPLFKD